MTLRFPKSGGSQSVDTRGKNHDTTPKRMEIHTGDSSKTECLHAPPPDALPFTIMLFFALLIAILLLLFGAIDPIGYEIEWALDNQLEDSVNDIEHQSNNQAAYTFAFPSSCLQLSEMNLQMPKSPSTSSAILPMHWNPCRAGFLRLSTPICCLHPAAVHFTF